MKSSLNSRYSHVIMKSIPSSSLPQACHQTLSLPSSHLHKPVLQVPVTINKSSKWFFSPQILCVSCFPKHFIFTHFTPLRLITISTKSNSMQKSLYWESNSYSAEWIPCLLCNLRSLPCSKEPITGPSWETILDKEHKLCSPTHNAIFLYPLFLS